MTEPITREELGGRFREAREARGLSAYEAAKIAGMAQARIGEIELGKHRPSFERVLYLVQVLRLDPRIIAPEFFPKSRKKS